MRNDALDAEAEVERRAGKFLDDDGFVRERPPLPPYSSGTSGSSKPALPASIQASASGRPCSAQRDWRGANSLPMNSRAAFWKRQVSSVIQGEW